MSKQKNIAASLFDDNDDDNIEPEDQATSESQVGHPPKSAAASSVDKSRQLLKVKRGFAPFRNPLCLSA